MYIKIVRYLEGRGVTSNNSEHLVVPKSVIMIDCDYVKYSKHMVLDFNEFEAYMIHNEMYNYSIIGEWNDDNHNILQNDLETKKEKRCEFILIYYTKGENFEYLVAPNCNMYLMNNDGKTIDSLTCK